MDPCTPDQSEHSSTTSVSHRGYLTGDTQLLFAQVSYLQQATVTLLPLLHIEVPTARPPQEAFWHVEQTHPAAMQQADGQICSAAAAELLTGHETDAQRS